MNSLASRRPDRELAAGKNYLCGASSFRLADYTGGLPCRGLRSQSPGRTPDHAFGPVGGLVCSKLIALLLGWWVRKRLWMVNLFYAGIICWNVYVLVVLTRATH